MRAYKDPCKPSLVQSGSQKGGQDLSQGVPEPLRQVLRAGAQLEDGQHLRARVDSQPPPQHWCGAASSGAPFVQLEVRELELARCERSGNVFACSRARVTHVVRVACR